MDPWNIIGWLFVFVIGGALFFTVAGFLVSLIIEGVATIRRNRDADGRVERQMRLYVEERDDVNP